MCICKSIIPNHVPNLRRSLILDIGFLLLTSSVVITFLWMQVLIKWYQIYFMPSTHQNKKKGFLRSYMICVDSVSLSSPQAKIVIHCTHTHTQDFSEGWGIYFIGAVVSWILKKYSWLDVCGYFQVLRKRNKETGNHMRRKMASSINSIQRDST